MKDLIIEYVVKFLGYGKTVGLFALTVLAGVIISVTLFSVVLKVVRKIRKITGHVTFESIDHEKTEKKKRYYFKKEKKDAQVKGTQEYLSNTGIMYRFGNYRLTPLFYHGVYRVLAAVLAGGISFVFGGILAGATALFVGYLAVDWCFNWWNKRDILEIEKEIYYTYVNLRIQLYSGRYLNDCLTTVQKEIKNERYKEAFDELIKNSKDKSKTMEESVDIFRTRFKSDHINKLCDVLSTLIWYGAVDQAKDLMEKEIAGFVESSSVRKVSKLKKQYDFAMQWLDMCTFIALAQFFFLKFGEHEQVTNVITGIIGTLVKAAELLGI